MNSHALARKLLEGRNLPVFIRSPTGKNALSASDTSIGTFVSADENEEVVIIEVVKEDGELTI